MKTGKHTLLILSLICNLFFLGFLPGLTLANTSNVSGYIVLRTGKTVDFIKLADAEDKYLIFKYGPQNKKTKIGLVKIQSVTFGENSESAHVVLKDGRKIKAYPLQYSNHGYPQWQKDEPYITVYYFDDIAKTERKEAYIFKNISRIVIGDDAGLLRKCTHCGAIWPDDYLFCPHDGEHTVWIQ